MAGSGVRYWNLARVLATQQPVTLAAPAPTDVEPPPGVSIVAYAGADGAASLVDLIAEHEVIVAQHLPYLEVDAGLLDQRYLVVDLYAPWILEKLEYARVDPERGEPDRADDVDILTRLLSLGDFFICASERQRDFWLGALALAGRLDLAHVQHDAELRGLIDVVGFGLPEDAPRTTADGLRATYPQIGADTPVILWNGGLWNWLDPFTAIKAVASLRDDGLDLALVFMGVHSPGAQVAQMRIVEDARQLAGDLGLLDRAVFFHDWVAYEDRAAWLDEAACVATLHVPTIEARYAYRTRLLDALWCEVPILATSGDVLADIVASEQIGEVVPPGDAVATSSAIRRLLDPERNQQLRERIAAVAPRYTWETVSRPLAEFCQSPQRISQERGINPERAYLHKLERLYTETAGYARHLEQTLANQQQRGDGLPLIDRILGRLRAK